MKGVRPPAHDHRETGMPHRGDVGTKAVPAKGAEQVKGGWEPARAAGSCQRSVLERETISEVWGPGPSYRPQEGLHFISAHAPCRTSSLFLLRVRGVCRSSSPS